MGPEVGYSLLKGHATNFIKASKGILEDKNKEHAFNLWLQNEKKSLLAKYSKKETEIANTYIELFFRIVSAFVYSYQNEVSFNSIGLIPDRERNYGYLKMNEYFVQLSFMSSREINTSKSLLITETELNKNKIRRANEDNRRLDKDYIIYYDFKNVTNLLVLGNPGVGKTTFAKWLCNWWTEDPEKVNGLPIYIELKRVVFVSSTNPLLQYLLQNYFPNETHRSGEIAQLIKKLSQHFLFILDGYDELNEENKRKLHDSILQLTSNTRYILTSRPYGILETYGLSWNQTIQLNGFDNSNIKNYISKFINNPNRNGVSESELIAVINHNPVLYDFAHNPLLLSFMVFIYLSDENAAQNLKSIESRFSLQEKVIHWMVLYHQKKGAANVDTALSEKAGALSFEMETDKVVEVLVNQSEKIVEEAMKPLSVIGLGQLNAVNEYLAKFYFSSITFQEYFAARFALSRITPAAFDYLSQDSFFWNLIAMVTGQLNNSSSLNLSLEKLVYNYERKAEKLHRNYSFYKYLLILSECKREFITQLMNKRLIKFIFMNFCKHIQNKHLRYGISECLQRIYFKMNSIQKDTFKELIIQKIDELWEPGDPEVAKKWEKATWILDEPISYFGLENDTDFIEQLLDLLLNKLVGFNQNNSEQGVFLTFPLYTIDLIKSMSSGFFSLHKTKIDLLCTQIPYDYNTEKAELEAKYKNAEKILKELEDLIQQFEESNELMRCEAGFALAWLVCQAGEFADEYGRIGQLDHLCRMFTTIINYLKAHDWFEKWDDSQRYDNPNNSLLQLVATGMIQFNNPEIYTTAIDLIYSNPELDWDLEPNNITTIYFNKYLNYKTNKLPLELSIRRLTRLISQVKFIRDKLPLYRNNLFEMLQSYVISNNLIIISKEFLLCETARLSEGLELANPPDENNTSFKSVAATLHEFHKLLWPEGSFESDKRYMIDMMLENGFQHTEYYRELILPLLMKENYIFTNISWEYFYFASEHSLKSKISVFKILLNESVHQYSGNLIHLTKLASRVLSWQHEVWFSEFLSNCKLDILSFITDIFLILQFSVHDFKKPDKLLIKVTGKLLSMIELRNMVLQIHPSINGELAGTYVLQYYFSQNEEDRLLTDYYELLQKDKLILSEFITLLYNYFSTKGQLDEAAIMIIEKTIGPKCTSILRKYAQEQLVFNFPFDKNKFLKLLKKTDISEG